MPPRPICRLALAVPISVALSACGPAPAPATAETAARSEPEAAPSAEPAPRPEASAEPSEAEPEADASDSEPAGPLPIPTACADADADVCTPPESFTRQLCLRGSPGVALAMFRKGSPWTRAYVRVNTEAWYAEGSLAHPAKVSYGEEVLIVANRAASTSGVQVVGAGSYDIYRWDGTCVSVQSDEVTLKRPPVPRVASIRWRRLADEVRKTLLSDRGIAFRNDLRRKQCRASKGRRCERAERALSLLIADYVRRGGAVPVTQLSVR